MILLAVVLSAQSGPAVDVEAGFGGRFFQDAWARVTVVVQNPGDDLEGRLRVRLLMGGRVEQELNQPVHLPARSRKRFTWDAWVDAPVTEVEAVLLDPKGRSLTAQSIPVRVLAPGLIQTVQVGGRFPGLEAKSELLIMGGTRGEAVGERRVAAGVKPDLLPESGIPLLGADALAFAEPVVLSPEQEEAVARWVKGGGTLLWSAGRAAAALQRPFWKEHCPARLGRFVHVEDDGLRTSMVEAEPEPGAIVVATLGGRPAVVRASRGLGEVVFLAVDPARLDGRPRYPAELLLPEDPLPPKLVPAPELKLRMEKDLGARVWSADQVAGGWLPHPWRPGPREPATAILWMSLYVVLLGPASWIFLRRRRRLGAPIFVTLAASAIVFTVTWGALSETEPVLVHRIIADPHRIQTWTRVNAGPGADATVETQGALAPLPNGEELARAQEAAGLLRLALPPKATSRFMSARTTLPEELGLEARWVASETLEIRNTGRLSLYDVQVVAEGRVWNLPDVESGVQEISLAELPSRGLEAWTAQLARVSRAGPRGTRWWEAGSWHPAGDQRRVRAFTFAEAIGRDVRQEWDRVMLRGVDLSRVKRRGRAVLLASFREDLSGLRAAPAARVEVEGVLRLVVAEGPR